MDAIQMISFAIVVLGFLLGITYKIISMSVEFGKLFNKVETLQKDKNELSEKIKIIEITLSDLNGIAIKVETWQKSIQRQLDKIDHKIDSVLGVNNK